MKRSCGVLMPIFSLPSPHGIGTLGRAAYDFIDFLSRAGQSFWQILPLGPTSYGDSPYQSSSAYAGNPYLIDLDLLCEEGLLTQAEIDAADFGGDPERVDYGKLYQNRLPLLRKAFARFDRACMQSSCAQQDAQSDYALFAALKQHFDGAAWTEWPDEGAKNRDPSVLQWYRGEQAEEIAFQHFLQYIFENQWARLKDYATKKGIAFIGDVPIYVPMDSCETWQHRQLFQLDADGRPTLVAGVPPDYFTALGQLWGNPVYDWPKHAEDGFCWWCGRISAAKARYDFIRIDHFRGLESYWAVPFGSPDARPGQWYPGPGMALIDALRQAHPEVRIIAEDLGYLTPEVKKLLSQSGYPGMRVMVFGFDPLKNSRELPHNYPAHCVAYTSTHDSSTAAGWFNGAPVRDAAFAVDYLGISEREGIAFAFLRGLYLSAAELAMTPMQDLLSLDDRFRTNQPGSLGWWTYRARPEDFSEALADRVCYYARMSGRA